MTNTILIGNIVTFAGAMIMVGIGLLKTKRNILLAQSVQCLIMGIGNLILGGMTGFLANMITIVRNLFCLKKELTTPWKLVFIALQLAIGVPFNNMGIIGLLPIIAACIFTWYLDTKSEVFLKLLIITTMVMWLIFDCSIHNYVSTVMDVFTIISNTAGIVMLQKNAKPSAGNERL